MDFEDILVEHGIETAPSNHRHSRSGWINFDCPFCGLHNKKYHMGYNVTFGYTNCWVCGGHNTVRTLMELTGLNQSKCLKLLKSVTRVIVKETRPRGKLVLPSGIDELKQAHKRYLKDERRYTDKEIDNLVNLWLLKGIGISYPPSMSWRLFIPVLYRHETVSWTSRSIGYKEPRYIAARPEQESLPVHETLYGWDYARNAVVVSEGPTDVWRIGPGAVATMGLGYSNFQLRMISQFPVRAICFDNSKAAQDRARKLVDDLSVFPGETHNIELDSEDPGSATKKEVKLIRRSFLE